MVASWWTAEESQNCVSVMSAMTTETPGRMVWARFGGSRSGARGRRRRLAGQACAGVRRGEGGKSALPLVTKLRATSVSNWLLLRA
jgi:hypothetical protein